MIDVTEPVFTVHELGDEFGLHPTNVAKQLRRLGVPILQVRRPHSRSPLSAVTSAGRARFLAERQVRGFDVPAAAEPAKAFVYLVNLRVDPDEPFTRFQIGWAAVAPTLTAARIWPTSEEFLVQAMLRVAETAAGREGGRTVGAGVYDVPRASQFLGWIDMFAEMSGLTKTSDQIRAPRR